VRSIGAGGVAAGVITGQLVSSVALDAGGAFGLDREPATAARALAAVLLALGTYAIVGGREDGAQGRPHLPRGPATVAVVLVGGLTAAQAPINADLAAEAGDLGATLVNFLGGTLVLAAIVVASGSATRLKRALSVPAYLLTGGVFGAVNILAGTALVRTIGAGGVTAALITGQLLSSVALDRAGAFGLHRRRIDGVRVAGVALLAAGTYLIVA
jgi:bacterial/archaeal transporter family-2 protein